MEKKTNKGVLVGIVLLVFATVAFAGYFVYGYLNKENLPKETNIENKEKKFDISEDEANILVSKYYKDGLLNTLSVADLEPWKQEYNLESEIFSVLVMNIPENDWQKIDCSTVAKKGEPGSGKEDYYLLNEYECTGKSISYDYMNKLYKELYGSSKTLKKESQEISILNAEYKGLGSIIAYLSYNAEKDIFVLGSFMGDANGPYESKYYSTLKGAEIKDEKLVITLAYMALLDYDSGEEGTAVYQIGKERIKPDDNKIKGLTEERIMEKYLDKLSTFEFTFVKDVDHYILESVK